HSDQVTWYVPIELAEGVSADQLVIKGMVDLQVCEKACIPKELPSEARVGEEVPVGSVRVDTKADPRKATHSKPDALRAPPSEAGVLKVEDSVVTWYGWIDNGTVKPGERAYLQLRAEMPERWHINAYAQQDTEVGPKPTLIAIESNPGIS